MFIYHVWNPRRGYNDLVDSAVVVADNFQKALALVQKEGYDIQHLQGCVIGTPVGSLKEREQVVNISRKVG